MAYPSTGQQRLSYDACLQQARQHNVQLKQALLDLEIASVRLKTRRAERLPVVNGTLRNNNSVGRSVDPLTNEFIDRKFSSLNGAVNSSIYVFEGFKTASEIKAARQEINQQTSQLQALENDIAVDLALAYIRINYLLEICKSQQQQLTLSTRLIELTRLKLSAGRVAESALFKLLSQQATEQLNLTKSQNDLRLAYLDLRQIMNAQPNDTFQILPLQYPVAAEAEFAPPTGPEVSRAVEAQPALAAKQYSALRVRHQIGVARADLYPSLQLTGSLGSNYSNTNQAYDFARQLNTNRSYGVGFVLAVPLFNSFRYKLLIKESRLEYQRELLAVDQERNRLNKVVQQAITDAQAASQSWKSAVQAEEFARKSYEADQLKYELGTISVFELNQAKATYVSAQADLFKAKYESILRSRLVGFYQGTPLTL
ncbi:outer membrane protein [Hymenobacter luteus]|uniref:Outer membrane protein n=2 Tax=Hymenobacter TaxID=89966 RepID=A0A7W9T2W2_9BACT|nr:MULTISPECIES: TolC family protein [Hymenobacter]MBB4602676.1 outer membrane protein [Hymenobacter latericoloratus]MBB6060567.1 outer membrane protein [Hymenobacter luteus]